MGSSTLSQTPTRREARPADDASPSGSVDLAGALALDRVVQRLLGVSQPTVQLGRYQVIDVIGRGAFGEVYRARDTELDREVAIKIVLPARTYADEGEAQRQLLAEARALARLRHGNVVEVFDVGVGVVARRGDGREQHGVYLVMQWLPGESLARWCERRPPWPAIVQAFAQIAAGLQAAHEAGLVHGDVKPHNAIIDVHGRVRVVDFGLSRELVVPHASHSTLDGAPIEHSASTIAGTPLYMAPEQHHGVMTPAADQFALSVSLWQALAGEAPFRGRSMVELLAAKLRTPPTPPRGEVPRAVWAALLRGLAVEPGARHRDLRAWQAALERAWRPDRSRVWLRAAAAVGAGALALVLAPGRADHPCDAAPLSLDAVWNEGARSTLRERLGALAHPDAPAIAQATLTAIDGRAQQWTSAWQQMCAAPPDPARHRCLADALDALDGAIARATDAGPAQLGGVVAATGAGDGRPCGDLGPAPDHAALEARVQQLEDRVADGVDPPTLGELDLALAAADASIRGDLAARVQHLAGRVAAKAGDHAGALERLREAIARADADGAHDTAIAALLTTIDVHHAVDDFDGGYAALLTARRRAQLHGTSREQEAALDLAAGRVLAFTGQHDEAMIMHGRACEQLVALPDPGPELAACTWNAVVIAGFGGHLDFAQRVMDAALAAAPRVRRPDRRFFARLDGAAGELARMRGDLPAAIVAARRAVERSRAVDPASDDVAGELSLLAELEATTGAWDDALAHYDQALALQWASPTPDPVSAAMWSTNRLAIFALQGGRRDQAIAELERLLAREGGATSWRVTTNQLPSARLLTAWNLWVTGDLAGARRELARYTAWQRSVGIEQLEAGTLDDVLTLPGFAARLEALLGAAGDPAAIDAFARGAAERRAAAPGLYHPFSSILDGLALATVQAASPADDAAVQGELRTLYATHARNLAALWLLVDPFHPLAF